MDIVELRELCLSFPHTTEEFPFDETTLVFNVFNKMFCCTDIMPFEWIAVKCDPDWAIELREKYPEITSAYHFNKKYWNGINMHGTCPTSSLKNSLNTRTGKLSKNFRKAL